MCRNKGFSSRVRCLGLPVPVLGKLSLCVLRCVFQHLRMKISVQFTFHLCGGESELFYHVWRLDCRFFLQKQNMLSFFTEPQNFYDNLDWVDICVDSIEAKLMNKCP